MKKSGSLFQIILGLIFITANNANLSARELAGINLEEQVTVAGISDELKLNGAGIRYKFFFKIYLGALYLPELEKDANVILESTGASRILMHFIYDEVERSKLESAWLNGFSNNTSKAVFSSLQERLARFSQMFSNMHQNDVVLLDYLPGTGTRVIINNEEKGVIEGVDFKRALLSVWLGEDPVAGDLKQAMLGLDD